MKSLLFRVLCRLRVDRILRWWNRKKLLVLMYHGVVEDTLTPFCWHQLQLSTFHQQMQWVRHHYKVLGLDEALELREKGCLPERACAITFDDGYANVATYALQVLEEWDLTATVFLVTGLQGEGALTWPDRVWLALAGTSEEITIEAVLQTLKALPDDERERRVRALEERPRSTPRADAAPFALLRHEHVRTLTERGRLRFGAHSKTHPILSRCDDEKVRDEVMGSVEALSFLTPDPVRVFAYPNGRPQDFDDRARKAVEHAGLRYAFSTVNGLVDEHADPLALPRVCVGADLKAERFRLLCAGL